MTYTTQSGDTFDLISFKVFGTCQYVDKIIDANRDKIDYFIFPAGVELTIPDITPEIKKTALPPWKRS